ncbi:bifunctional hydroxymethylpyrimidine kinase/phosphomethylpyrimidine kinase [Tissierella creatinophila]|uniref:Hydroxymethylpyrimidine/phosphomethylpyrimidine kinase n=1 Tax=Tissierella creatinophila DSM 6911 TaxID=1123403 RepID=A0A1U7M7L7_TISCR|nr:bifunctional hydroxymethylpyrimidine kinase/phosphomethylpyrimidine kinase [Tissierella creatinophila]OLS03209.1 hydroxymethylpyrimidine/phosphomethylpyrimidine kinase [Tissierella creatinophila DSM 6911]
MKKLLTIAGSDCSGGAGIQADLKTFAAHKTYGMSVITSLTAQNTMGVTDVVDLSPEFVGKQLDAVFSDIYPDAIKIGMVSNESIIKVIARKLREYGAKNIVVDPVMVATSGSVLMDSKANNTLINELLPLADIITPNMQEASVLSGIEVNNKEDMEKAAKIIAKFIDGAILVKGGHLETSADDLLLIDGKINWIEGEKIENPNTHGTGCTLSSAIAVNLANGMDVESSFIKAKEYLIGAIGDGLDLGEGRGPLNHLY